MAGVILHIRDPRATARRTVSVTGTKALSLARSHRLLARKVKDNRGQVLRTVSKTGQSACFPGFSKPGPIFTVSSPGGHDDGPGLECQPVGSPATVTVTASGTGTPTGTVTFKAGATAPGPVTTLDASGQATFTTSALTVGSHSITAVYGGDANFATSTSAALNQNAKSK